MSTSLIKCKKLYSPTGKDVSTLTRLPLRELREISDILVCEGMVIEAEKALTPNRKFTEFTCIICGHNFYFETRKYMKVLKALGIDYSGRVL